ncbi:Ama1p KNAG_0A01610 [Huiozyma naganishii CBS 8797]|uniref:CDC20/Fizzy WD40 domain-containing protein n=1 Tax=Huiozyma naganishii (strain ATCC MYA-139 / BCRC 22969 / CBS 8797 / KCTC 17520 / NBRC 10181 / NCYC 3082 / Yp74L-3) TaxID=1071383 RepID=J7QZF4_HUIN7|nr:hypothetical protein KNAG_0A01610 [Kazachstania naganishii CBS 8797]CCK67850.1 hypothetical protein KNAG_0A01610 [Kazachstania naganishii CBS 8797]
MSRSLKQVKASPQADRYIPQSASKRAYRASPSLKKFNTLQSPPELSFNRSPSPERLSSPEFLNGEGRYGPMANDDSNSLVDTSNELTPATAEQNGDDYAKIKLHRAVIATSLGFHREDNRVYNFSSNGLAVPPSTKERPVTNRVPSRRAAKRAKSHMPFRVLDAPCLRNDFYSNLISWSARSGNVLVALGCSVYLWVEEKGALPILMHSYLHNQHDVVTCVSFDKMSSKFLIGTKRGLVILFDEEECLKKFESNHSVPPGGHSKYSYRTLVPKSVTCIEWFGGRTGDVEINRRLLVGEDNGDVSLVEINTVTNTMLLKMKFSAHGQQVCGLSINYNNKLIAVGGNDNACTIWDISDIHEPSLKNIFPHSAAVKAVAFCPWSKSLLATGGGSKDRTIKFWHVGTGTLINEIRAKAQVTSLIWSPRYKQIAATFGFSNVRDPVLLKLYSYPQLEKILEVKSPTPLRALSSSLSPTGSSICVATTDETLRFYKLWDEKEDVIRDIQEEGVFGSILIEHLEGINYFAVSKNRVLR